MISLEILRSAGDFLAASGEAWVAFLLILGLLVVVVAVYLRDGISVTLAALVMLSYPVLTPLLTELLGYQYFTLLNYGLQNDRGLMFSGVSLHILAVGSFLLGASLGSSESSSQELADSPRFFTNRYWFWLAALGSLVLVIAFLEASTVLTVSYGELKLENEASSLSSTAQQFFYLTIALALGFIPDADRKRLIAIVMLIFLVIFLLYARRTVAASIILIVVLMYNARYFKVRTLLFAFAGLSLLYIVGEMRTVGILAYLEGARTSYTPKDYFALPGGAGNIFISSIGIIDLLDAGNLRSDEEFLFFGWFVGAPENSIYSGKGYQYNGGMYFANLALWNFGIFGVVGLLGLLGWLARKSDAKIRQGMKSGNGGLPTSLAVAFTMTLPLTLWYHPTACIRLSLAIAAIYGVFWMWPDRWRSSEIHTRGRVV